MKKKIISLLCVFAMLACMLAGCGSDEAPEIKTPEISSIEAGSSSGGSFWDQPSNGSSSGGSFWDQPTEATYTVYVKAYSGWGTARLWAWSETGEGDLYEEWPGMPLHAGSDGWSYMTISQKYDYIVINGLDGEIQTEDEYTGGKDIWITIQADGYYVDTTKPSDYDYAPEADNGNYIAELTGTREKVHLQDGNSSLNVTATIFDQTVYNCTEMTISMEVEMNAGTSCKDWQVWGRSGNSFVKIAQIYLAAGNGFTSETLTFSTPITFDAIAITPTIPGGYSWAMGFVVTDVWTK